MKFPRSWRRWGKKRGKTTVCVRLRLEELEDRRLLSTIWSPTATPLTASSTDTNPIEVGVKFRSDEAGYVTGISFYKGANNAGTHVGHLWTDNGTLLATATF